MARLALMGAPGVPHHVTQEGNRRRRQVISRSAKSSDTELEALPRLKRTGRPLGDDDFITRLESALGSSMRREKTRTERLDARSSKMTMVSPGIGEVREILKATPRDALGRSGLDSSFRDHPFRNKNRPAPWWTSNAESVIITI
jgi:hypothetical protein